MEEAARSEWWERLPAGIREQIDGYVLQDSMLAAARVVIDVGFKRDGIGVGEAQLIVGDRYAHYGDRIAKSPDSPLDLESLARRVEGLASPVLAIEAIWDGDTVHDWFVCLQAVTVDPAHERTLAVVYRGAAKRYLGDDADHGRRHPAAVVAERVGGSLAARLSVPFHFASPDLPDDDAPRRRSSYPR